MEWEKVVGANIKRFRKEVGMTQEKLALAAEIDLRYLGGVERGEYNPTIFIICQLAAVLDIHPGDLFDEEVLDMID